MFSSFSLPFSSFRANHRSDGPISIAEVPVHDVQKASDKRGARLRALLKANHASHSIIYHNLTFHNHTPHLLGSAYIFGGQAEHLTRCYEAEDGQLEPWKPSPGEISKEDWQDYLGKRQYQRAFVDFFEDQLVAFGYDWKTLVERYMFENDRPLISAVVSGLAHPLIHLAYAYELNSQDVAVEALALTACFYDGLHKYLDNPLYTRPASYQASSVLVILKKIETDARFDGLFKSQAADPDTGEANVDVLMLHHEDAILDHWNAWKLQQDPCKQFEEAQRTAVTLLTAARHEGEKFDFFLLHTLTSSHAVRVLLPVVPPHFQIPLLRAWFLFTILAYVGQKRPHIGAGAPRPLAEEAKGWKHVVQLALSSAFSTDAHFVKGLRAMQSAAETWGDDDGYFLSAALYFGDNFDGFGGFGSAAV